jgi:hypothetical protein
MRRVLLELKIEESDENNNIKIRFVSMTSDDRAKLIETIEINSSVFIPIL